MMANAWLAMPAVDGGTMSARPKYALDASAFVIYQGGDAYVALKSRRHRQRLLKNPDVRLLRGAYAEAFEDSLPFPVQRAASQSIGLGDLVSWVASRVGIRECEPCRRRKVRLNEVRVWGWWHR